MALWVPRRSFSKVPEGQHPRGTTLREALRGNSTLRGLCGGLSEGSAVVPPRVLRGSAGLCGGPRDFPRIFGGSDPMLVTLRSCWIFVVPARHRHSSVSFFLSFWEKNLQGLKAGLGSPSSAEPVAFCRTFLQYYAKPSCRTPKISQGSEEGGGALTCLLSFCSQVWGKLP